jgi:glycosyltransferase involved in cell wall biosynthesis
VRLALWAQRHAHVVPAPIRSAAGHTLRRLAGQRNRATGPSEDWGIPLVAGGTSGDLEALQPQLNQAPPAPNPASPAVTVPTLSCVIATGILDVGGAEEFAAFLSRRLPGLGIATTVVYAGTHLPGQVGEGGRLARRLTDEGIRCVELAPDTVSAWLATERPDVISAHYAPDWMLDAAAAAGIPWVETLHGMHSFFHPDSWEPERRRAEQITTQIAVSELVRRQYLARNPAYPAGRVITVPNGVDRARVATVDREQARAALGLTDEFLFVSLARYCLQKNNYGLVAAFGELARTHPQAHLVAAGRVDEPLYFEQTRLLAESAPAADRIHLRGHCQNPTALLAAADAFVLDSFFEGWALSSMEALAAGLPVVLSDVGGAREQLVGTGQRGHLVHNPGGDAELVDWRIISELRFRPQDNRAELVAAMSSVIDNRVHWAASRQRIRDEAVTMFSPDLCLQGHAEVLRDAAVSRRSPDTR